ncbi:hypothetical protein BC829DRAFT_385144 [Chytridium lagenaria]|nr:hypothetical protein BC829DRAFT_385144 [Chytridium lagenaria]
MSLSVEIAPVDNEADFAVGFPCVGPVTVKGVCRISNVGNAAVNLGFLEILLNGESGGSVPNGGTVEAMSLLFARQVLVVTEHPPVPIGCSTFLDLPFQFEFTRENASLLPPSSCISRDYMEGYVKYELRVSWKESVKGEPNDTTLMRSFSRTSDPCVFRYPRFDLDDLIQYFYGKATKGISGRSDDNTVKFSLVLPNSLIPDDVFKFEYAVVSTEPKNAIKAVHLQIWERLTLETLDGNDVDKNDMVFIYTGEPANPAEPALELKRKVLLRAPKWVTSSQPATEVSTITPSVFSGSVKISHFMRVLLEVQSGLSVTIDSDVNVIPVTRSLLSDLASHPEALRGANDPKATKLAVVLESLGPSIDTAVSMNRNLMSEDEELAFALQASMKASTEPKKASAEDDELERALQLSKIEAIRSYHGRSQGSSSSAPVPTVIGPDGRPAPPPRGTSKVTTINGIVPEDEALRLAIEKSQQSIDPLQLAEEEAIRLAILESQLDDRDVEFAMQHELMNQHRSSGSSSSSSAASPSSSSSKAVVVPLDQPVRTRVEMVSMDNDDEPSLKRGPGFFTIVGSKFESAISYVAPTNPTEPTESPSASSSTAAPATAPLSNVRKAPPPMPPPRRVPFAKLLEQMAPATQQHLQIPGSGGPVIEPRLSSRLSKRDGFRAAKAPSTPAAAVSVQLSSTAKAEDGKIERRVVVFDYTPMKADEIPLTKGAVVIVTKKFMDGGCLGYLENEGHNFEGHFPSAALSPYAL